MSFDQGSMDAEIRKAHEANRWGACGATGSIGGAAMTEAEYHQHAAKQAEWIAKERAAAGFVPGKLYRAEDLEQRCAAPTPSATVRTFAGVIGEHLRATRDTLESALAIMSGEPNQGCAGKNDPRAEPPALELLTELGSLSARVRAMAEELAGKL